MQNKRLRSKNLNPSTCRLISESHNYRSGKLNTLTRIFLRSSTHYFFIEKLNFLTSARKSLYLRKVIRLDYHNFLIS